MKTLMINFSSPLQSYGNEASFSRRTSSDYPSKSAVIGILAAAMGYRRDDNRITALNNLKFAVRVDQPGRTLTDYQTVEWKKGTRKITYRDYLQDAVFVVAVGSNDPQLIDKLAYTLRHPKFQLFLGRRANVPAGPLKLHTVADKNPIQALSNLEWQASTWFQRQKEESVVSVDLIADADLLPKSVTNRLAKDNVISFDQRHRQLSYRAIASQRIPLTNKSFGKAIADTNHDAFTII
ncbi:MULTISPECIES: type I-E CRISPR-associated protein Cas5/CasD [Lactiplantibacillus]|uniref:type I-E CRISPR-associated protein Cas5/CasD n=1 Tax=Lactiplantibacillus TaxID=2767842 RepID=UPI00097657BE|nr:MULTISPECIES: type I-E CRISPR-associated protein Cas5/CasD [Lactiplantibacillus]MDL2063460.1 type I-E CRISPR-associated protein Cas5/CasD [Lactiplantibacillus paraplantarum]PKX58731.1 type I-E CRISPR-associated protein Cas5/CasD [Lactiplantibacillus plantarum]